jgi:hypothetical protein
MYYYGQFPYQVYVDPRINLYRNLHVPPNHYLFTRPDSGQQGWTLIHKQVIDLNNDGRNEVVELIAWKDQYDENSWKLGVDGKEVETFDSYNKTYQSADMKFERLFIDRPSIFHTGNSRGTVVFQVGQI